MRPLHHPLQIHSLPPKPEDLRALLGNAAPLWEAVISLVREGSPNLTEVWHFAGSKIGWSLRLVDDARILVYLTPREQHFTVGIVLGKKAVIAARRAGLTKAAAGIIDSAPVYAEGHGIRFQVKSSADMESLRELLAIKIAAPGRPSGKSRRLTRPC